MKQFKSCNMDNVNSGQLEILANVRIFGNYFTIKFHIVLNAQERNFYPATHPNRFCYTWWRCNVHFRTKKYLSNKAWLETFYKFLTS